MWDLLQQTKNTLEQKYYQVFDHNLRLAVTGLSRSGKTAFITSLINHLLNADDDRGHLALFTPVQQQQILSCKIVPQPNFNVPSFTYSKNLSVLSTNPPTWPQATTDISEIRLAIRYQNNKSFFDKLTSINFREHNTLYLDLIDYPGEWLLDLPLLHLSYAQWSQSGNFLDTALRQKLAQPWLQTLEQLDLYAPVDLEQLAQISQLYTEFLHQCKAQGLEFIQPGRFVLPGSYKNSPLLTFFPLVHIESTEWSKLLKHASKEPNSTIAILKERYEQYVEQLVKGFYEQHFKRFDRQIILVDCLTPLNHSDLAFFETKKALEQIFAHFTYGQRSLWHRLFMPQIDKLAFAATKADHITSDQWSNLVSLLKNLTRENLREVNFKNIETAYFALAAIRATEQLEFTQDGKTQFALAGKRLGESETSYQYPGQVPSSVPQADFWQNNKFAFDQYHPLPLNSEQRINAIGMDKVLDFLLADKFA
ncbi:YcjX family GTP-binding protein [Psittacicella hinzii]|uniref:YcjX family protein n=1 Tax=Psittacicella hinzii TaxID=2028575 RepID=A0A3A1YRB5_9GAMM|nr:YcjX family protein [Psittacicella hinzii]RIY38587.1 hypothetical protein CKF58_03955 [Psittacicella hinzii]